MGTVLRAVTNGALSQSHQPFDGAVVHATVFNSAFWLKSKPHWLCGCQLIHFLLPASSFVDMYEKGDYVYAFFREITVELNPNVSERLLEEHHLLYNILQAVRSRVARICKVRNI